MTSTIRFILLAGLLAAFVAACGGTVSEPSNNIDSSLQGQWAITGALNGDGDLAAPLAGTSPFVAFSPEGVSGTTGCNSFFATVDALPDGTWNSSEIGMTAMGCEPDLADQEKAITNAIASATLWSVDENTAQLSAAGIVLMTMESWQVELTSGEWSVTGINNGKGGVVSTLVDTDPRIAFTGEDRVTADAGCNNMFGSFVAGDSTLTISELASTKKLFMSSEGVMEQEQQMANALAAAASYSIDGNQLTIRDADGATQITAIPSEN